MSRTRSLAFSTCPMETACLAGVLIVLPLELPFKVGETHGGLVRGASPVLEIGPEVGVLPALEGISMSFGLAERSATRNIGLGEVDRRAIRFRRLCSVDGRSSV